MRNASFKNNCAYNMQAFTYVGGVDSLVSSLSSRHQCNAEMRRIKLYTTFTHFFETFCIVSLKKHCVQT